MHPCFVVAHNIQTGTINFIACTNSSTTNACDGSQALSLKLHCIRCISELYSNFKTSACKKMKFVKSCELENSNYSDTKVCYNFTFQCPRLIMKQFGCVVHGASLAFRPLLWMAPTWIVLQDWPNLLLLPFLYKINGFVTTLTRAAALAVCDFEISFYVLPLISLSLYTWS